MSKTYEDLPLKDSQKKAFFVSATFHALFLLFLFIQSVCAPVTERIPKKLFVQSIALKAQPSTTQKKVEPCFSPTPKQEIAAVNIPEEKPNVAEEPEPPKEEKPVEIIEKPSPKEEPAQPVEEAPQPSQKPKETTKQSSKKTTPVTAKNKKAPPKQPQKSSTSTKQKQPTSKKPVTPTYDKKLVAEAIERLNNSHKATHSSGSGTGNAKGSTGKVSRIGSIGALHSDVGVSTQDGAEDGPEFSETSSEGCYIMDLIRRLQLNIRLSEPGEIRIKLSLKKNGQVQGITVVSCKNEKIKKSLLEKLHSVHFSPFGQSFPGEAEHTFLLKLSNDLSWSCS